MRPPHAYLHRLLPVAVLAVGLLLAPGAASAPATGTVYAWGCRFANHGQGAVPAAASSGVGAIAAAADHSLALKNGGVIAWGCGLGDYGQCTVPAAATSGVTAIAAGDRHSLALKVDGSVVAWGCTGFGSE